jgi:hypothetical protein
VSTDRFRTAETLFVVLLNELTGFFPGLSSMLAIDARFLLFASLS